MATDETPWTIGRLLNWTTDYLASRGSESPRLEAEVLLAQARGCQRIELYTAFDEVPNDSVRGEFKGLVQQRAAGAPVAYLVGSREFYSLPFKVTPDVLIPRPETEQLVVTLLDQIKERDGELSVIDVGTGSGVIAVCVAKHAHSTRVTAVDVSDAALAVARENAERHGVADRIEFFQSDLFAAIEPDRRFDFIASNPPYVTTNELVGLEAMVRDHEPHLALDGGPEGTTVIERLLAEAPARLSEGGELLFEIGPTIANRVEEIVNAAPGLLLVETLKDLAGHERVVWVKRG